MKIYSRHNCQRQHRSVRAFIRCAIPNTVWVMGTGEIALIAWCGEPSVSLWGTVAEAEGSREFIDQFRCGHRCGGRHDIVRIRLDSEGVA